MMEEGNGRSGLPPATVTRPLPSSHQAARFKCTAACDRARDGRGSAGRTHCAFDCDLWLSSVYNGLSPMKVQLPSRFNRTSAIDAAGLILALVVSVQATPAAEEFAGRVVAVADGDTITVLHAGTRRRIRLNGIDCPEKKQAFGASARAATGSLALGQTVRVVASDTDKYGRTVADVYLPDGSSLNEQLVAGGLAWHYRKYSSDRELSRLESQARLSGQGLWADPAPIPPWSYRALANMPAPRSTGVYLSGRADAHWRKAPGSRAALKSYLSANGR